MDARVGSLFADFEAELEMPRSGVILEMSRTNSGCEHDFDEDSYTKGGTLTISPKAEDRESLFEP